LLFYALLLEFLPMKKSLIYLITLSLLFAACGKEQLSIGKGKAEDEIKKCNKLLDEKEYEDAVQCLEMFKSRYAHSSLAQDAELEIGDAYFDKKEYLLSAESYAAFIKLYPRHPKIDYAYYRTGTAYLRASPKAIDRDQEYLGSAIEYLNVVVYHFSRSPYVSLASKELYEALSRVARRDYYIGKFYYRTGEYLACIDRFKDISENYKPSGLADKSLYFITSAYLELGKLDDAKEAYSKMSVDYPESKWTKKAASKLKKYVRHIDNQK